MARPRAPAHWDRQDRPSSSAEGQILDEGIDGGSPEVPSAGSERQEARSRTQSASPAKSHASHLLFDRPGQAAA